MKASSNALAPWVCGSRLASVNSPSRAVPDFARVRGNVFAAESEVDLLKHACALDKLVSTHTHGAAFRKCVFGCRASNELLPFVNDARRLPVN